MLRGGFVDADELLQGANQYMRERFSLADVEEVVRRDRKQRFCIKRYGGQVLVRANQGHTMTIQGLELQELCQEPTYPVIHGTTMEAWVHIERTGLNRMARQYMHFATGLPGEVRSGIRASSQVLIYINMEKALNDGIRFFLSTNGVVLSSGIDGVLSPDYFKDVLFERRRPKVALIGHSFVTRLQSAIRREPRLMDNFGLAQCDVSFQGNGGGGKIMSDILGLCEDFLTRTSPDIVVVQIGSLFNGPGYCGPAPATCSTFISKRLRS